MLCFLRWNRARLNARHPETSAVERGIERGSWWPSPITSRLATRKTVSVARQLKNSTHFCDCFVERRQYSLKTVVRPAPWQEQSTNCGRVPLKAFLFLLRRKAFFLLYQMYDQVDYLQSPFWISSIIIRTFSAIMKPVEQALKCCCRCICALARAKSVFFPVYIGDSRGV